MAFWENWRKILNIVLIQGQEDTKVSCVAGGIWETILILFFKFTP